MKKQTNAPTLIITNSRHTRRKKLKQSTIKIIAQTELGKSKTNEQIDQKNYKRKQIKKNKQPAKILKETTAAEGECHIPFDNGVINKKI